MHPAIDTDIAAELFLAEQMCAKRTRSAEQRDTTTVTGCAAPNGVPAHPQFAPQQREGATTFLHAGGHVAHVRDMVDETSTCALVLPNAEVRPLGSTNRLCDIFKGVTHRHPEV